VQPTQPTVQEFVSPLIQRAIEIPDRTLIPGRSADESSAGAAEMTPAEKQKLADQVYNEIKRRLAYERERGRGRF
jgi:hypothetical protein